MNAIAKLRSHSVWTNLKGKYVMETILIVLCVVLAFVSPNFFTAGNLLNIIRNVSLTGIIAFGMTMVIIAGEIDLSVGAAVAFSGCVTAYLTRFWGEAGLPIVPAVLIAIVMALAIGFLFGCFSAWMKNRFGIPTFITTLALMTVETGFAYLITRGFPLTPFPQWFNFLGSGYVYGIPFPAILFVIVFGIFYVIMGHTSFGRSVYAVGGNQEAARLSGINVAFVKTMALGITSMLAALSGVLVASQIMSGTPTAARGWEMIVISAVIIGGTSLFGGSGNVRGTLVGVIFLGVLVNGMTLMNVSEYWQYVVRGALILLAVLLNMTQQRRAG